MNKHYNLTEYAGENIKDKAPDWISKFCKDNKEGFKKDIREAQQLKDKKSIYEL